MALRDHSDDIFYTLFQSVLYLLHCRDMWIVTKTLNTNLSNKQVGTIKKTALTTKKLNRNGFAHVMRFVIRLK